MGDKTRTSLSLRADILLYAEKVSAEYFQGNFSMFVGYLIACHKAGNCGDGQFTTIDSNSDITSAVNSAISGVINSRADILSKDDKVNSERLINRSNYSDVENSTNYGIEDDMSKEKESAHNKFNSDRATVENRRIESHIESRDSNISNVLSSIEGYFSKWNNYYMHSRS